MGESNLILHIKAPCGVSRQLSTENHRGTYPILSHTTLYGLLCNLAGVEMREYDSIVGNMVIKDNLPTLGIRIGYVKIPMQSRLFEHTLKLMKNAELKNGLGETRRVCRQFIKPKRSDYLVDLDFYVEVLCDIDLINRMKRYLSGINVDPIKGTDTTRYGLPFIGSNSCTIQSIDVVDVYPDQLFWVNRMSVSTQKEHLLGVSMPVWIDRRNPNNTKYQQFSVMRTDHIGDVVSIGPME